MDQSQDLNQPILFEQDSTRSKNEKTSISEESRHFLESLQGDLPVLKFEILEINYQKVMLILPPLILSIIGLILLFRSVRFRIFCFYRKSNKKSTHIYVKSYDEIQDICRLTNVKTANTEYTLFKFEDLTYQLYQNQPLPLGIKLKEDIQRYINQQFIESGLTQTQVEERLVLFGRNQHITKIPPYHLYLADSITQPFIILQYLTSFIYFMENSLLIALVLISTSMFTIHINYILLRKSYQKLKGIAKKRLTVKVKRNGQFVEIDGADLLPGDLYISGDQIPCDSLVLSRDLFVNEVGFTGENIPVGKFELISTSKIFQSQHWVYEGSPVISQKEKCLLLAINTGYSSRKGRIIRKIQINKKNFPDIFKNVIWLAGENLLLNLSLYGIFFDYMFDDLDFTSIIYFRFIDFIINSVPAVLHIYINLLYSFSLIRLNKNDIIGTECQKTTTSSRLQTICFDKTGTLTQNTVQIAEMILFVNNQRLRLKSDAISAHPDIVRLFASCHSVQQLGGVMHGDEIDIKMFASAKAHFVPSVREEVIHEIHGDGFELQVCKIHQFQSRFQSMSVLVRDKITKELFIFVKGSPQKIDSHSTQKHEGLNALVKELSLQGYRTIAIGIRRIDSEDEFARLVNADREDLLRDIRLIGLATFTNKFKSDASQVVEALLQAQITIKIITGDNLFVAVQTALALGIVPSEKSVIALEGSKLQPDGSLPAVVIKITNGVIKEEQITIPNIDDYDFSGKALAMDFDFIKRKESLFINLECTIFARATPETKTLIVKKEKEKLQQNFNNGSWKERWFGGRLRKVGMVGDGANDLMAIREADIGIGISDSDAVYSSDFTIKNLSQISFIIRESKAAERRLIEICLFTIIINSLLTVFQILNTHQSSNFPLISAIHRNYLLCYPIILFLSFSSPSEKLTKYCPSSNMVGLENHLLLWGSMIINSMGIAIPCLYYSSSPYFHPNNNKTSLISLTDTSTITYLSTVLLTSLLMVGLHHSNPWKIPIWKNIPLCLAIGANFILITLIFMNTQYALFLGLTALDKETAFECYLITLGIGIANIIYCQFVRSLHLYKKQFDKKYTQLNLINEGDRSLIRQ